LTLDKVRGNDIELADQRDASRTGGIELKKKHAGGKTTSGFSTGRQIVAVATALLVALAVLFSAAGILFISAGTVAAATVVTVPGGTGPMGVAFNPHDNKVYLANGNFAGLPNPRTSGNTVSVLNTADNSVATLTVAPFPGAPAACTYNPDDHLVYGTNIYSLAAPPGSVWKTDGSTVTTGPQISLGFAYIMYNSGDHYLYASNIADNKIYRIDPATQQVTPTHGSTVLTTGGTAGRTPIGMIYCPTNNKLYVACSGTQAAPPATPVMDNRLFAINMTTWAQEVITTNDGPLGLVYDSVDNKIFVGCNGTAATPGNTVQVINPATNAITNTITVGSGVFGMAYSNTLNRVYTANSVGNSVTIIDAGAETVVETVTGGGLDYPLACDVNPATNKVYFGNFGTNAAPPPGGVPGTTITIITDSAGPPPPDPTTTSISPTSKVAGEGDFTLDVYGTNFVGGVSKVRWNGDPRTTTFVSDTHLQAAISSADIASVGTASVKVYNAGATNPESGPQTFTINPGAVPSPTTTSISPTSKAAGQPAFTLTVNGTNFVAGSVVRWNTSPRTTHFQSSTQLTADIPDSDITSAGTASVTVYNAGAATPESNPQALTITALLRPTISSLDPKSKVAGQPAFTLTVNGTNFVDGLSVVRWKGVARTTHFQSSTQLTADIPGSDIALVGSARVTVYNAGAERPESNAKSLSIKRPRTPTITSISPTFKVTGELGFTLTVTGTNFVDGLSQVRWNGSARTTHYTSATVLTADIPASDIASVGSASVTVYNPGARTPESRKALTFSIGIPPNPTTTSISPTSKVSGQPAFSLTVNGTNFVEGLSVVRWKGSARTTHVHSSTLLTADINASDIASAGTASVTVYNAGAPTPESNAQTLTINAPLRPTITSIDPKNRYAGQPAFALIVNGTNFVEGLSVVQWKGAARTTHYVSATQITADIPAPDIAAAGSAKVTVLTPGTTVSNYKIFYIKRPSRPTISSISPASKAAGQTGFTLTVNGNYYLDGISVVRWNGVARATTFVSKTQLKAEISASDIATAGTAIVTVYNAGAGTPESAPKTFTITP